MSDSELLKKFTGDYTLGGEKVILSLRGSRLVLIVGSQRPYLLEPDIDGWFNLKGLTGFRARLLPDKIEISQPEGLFTATREQKPAPSF